jgi:hypothetical protein
MDDAAFALAARLVDLGRLWLLAGAITAAAFLGFGLDRVAPAARGAWAFRPLLAPGLVLLWPLVLWRWAAREAGRADPAPRRAGRAHLAAWAVLAAVLPAILIAAALHRAPRETPAAVRLDAAAGAATGAKP